MTLRLGQHMPHECDIQLVVYLTPCGDSRGYAKCIVNIPELVMLASQPALRKRL